MVVAKVKNSVRTSCGNHQRIRTNNLGLNPIATEGIFVRVCSQMNAISAQEWLRQGDVAGAAGAGGSVVAVAVAAAAVAHWRVARPGIGVRGYHR